MSRDAVAGHGDSGSTEVEVDAATAAAIRDCGGQLYVWRDDPGFEHVATIAPYGGKRFEYDNGGPGVGVVDVLFELVGRGSSR